jgi:hypothetical protein
MRVICCSTLFGTLLVLLGASCAVGQDTNFATGPQYLMQGPARFARPISTRSISLSGPPLELGASNATAALIPGASNEEVLPPNADALPAVDLFPIFYANTSASDLKLSFLAEPFPDAQRQAVYSVLPLKTPGPAPEPSSNRLAANSGAGTRGTESLAEVAAYDKARTRHATRVYTNADIDRLHSGS